MQNTETSHFSLPYVLIFGILAGALGMQLVSSILRRAGVRRIPYWARLWWELALGITAAAGAFRLYHHGIEEFSYENVGEAMIHTLFVVLAIELVRAVHGLEKADHRLDDLEKLIFSDERIIVARREPVRDRREFAVVGVEVLDSGQLPQSLKPSPHNGKWALTISVLRVDRIQDLLFSPEYLNHFLTLHLFTEKQFRILIINDKPRSEAAIRSFLQMSEQIPPPNRIRTYIYLKSEFYQMLNCVDRRLSRTEADEIRKIMDGQPDLSLMRDESDQPMPVTMTTQDDYILRYRDDTVLEFGSRLPVTKKIHCVDHIHKLMHVAIKEPGREGVANLQKVLGGSIPNPWFCDSRMDFLRRSSMRLTIQRGEMRADP